MITDIEPMSLRVLIVDSEPSARDLLQKLLANMPAIALIDLANSGPAAAQAIRQHRPDIVFIETQAPALAGMDVIDEIGLDKMPATIFVTHDDRHALQAFEVGAVDYLLKPLTVNRLAVAVQRAQQAVEARSLTQPGIRRDLSSRTFNSHSVSDRDRASDCESRYIKRIAVELRGQLRTIPVTQIDYIVSSGVYAELHVGDKSYPLRVRMKTLEQGLDPACFMRIHRSSIVQLGRIEMLSRQSGSDYHLRLTNGVQLAVARTKIKELEQWMGLINPTHSH
ncbi:MAG: LytTR family DNA-binding domain-containing protein [Steroidobacteraceae bacterium]